jgi:hypothetical protein
MTIFVCLFARHPSLSFVVTLLPFGNGEIVSPSRWFVERAASTSNSFGSDRPKISLSQLLYLSVGLLDRSLITFLAIFQRRFRRENRSHH